MVRHYPVVRAAAKPSMQRIRAHVVGVQVLAAAVEGANKSPPRFDATVYAGGLLRVENYELPIVLDLQGMAYAKSIVANLDHKRDQRVGQATERDNDGRRLRLGGTLSAATPFRDEVVNSAADGWQWEASVEASPKQVETVPAGKQVVVNGQTFTGPIFVARRSLLHGFAFLSEGADQSTSVTIAAAAAINTRESVMDFETWVKSLGLDAATLTDALKAALMKCFEGQQTPPTPPAVPPVVPVTAGGTPPTVTGAPAFDASAITAGYVEHLAAIDALFLAHEDEVADKKQLATIKAAAAKEGRELKAQAAKERWSGERFELATVKAAAKVELELVKAAAPVGPAIHSSHKDVTAPVIEAALCRTLGVPKIEKQYTEQVLEQSDRFRNLGLQQVMIMAAASRGYHCRAGERIHNGNLREVLEYAFARVHAAPSTLSLPGILQNVANKELLAGYEEEDQTWREISVVKTATDFKQMTSHRLTDSLEYEEIGPDGKIKHGKVGEESYTRQVKTYAKMGGLTRQDIINDDLGAFDDIRARLGRGGAKKLNNVFWTATRADHSTFFTAARGNYITGATTTLLTDGVGLGLAIAAFRKMKSPSADGSKRLGGQPAILLVPPELEGAADKLFMGEKLNVGSAAGEENTYRNKYRPVVVPWLSDSDFTGSSATAWYLLRPVSAYPMMAVSFLFGQQSPTVESADADFDELGVQFRGFHDFGCDKAEYVCGVKSKGAA